MDKAEKNWKKSKAFGWIKRTDKNSEWVVAVKLDKFKQNSKIKLKFRTVGGVDQEVLCRKAEQLRDKLDKLSEKINYPMTKRKTNWKTRRY
jgi:hypothetical protein